VSTGLCQCAGQIGIATKANISARLRRSKSSSTRFHRRITGQPVLLGALPIADHSPTREPLRPGMRPCSQRLKGSVSWGQQACADLRPNRSWVRTTGAEKARSTDATGRVPRPSKDQSSVRPVSSRGTVFPRPRRRLDPISPTAIAAHEAADRHCGIAWPACGLFKSASVNVPLGSQLSVTDNKRRVPGLGWAQRLNCARSRPVRSLSRNTCSQSLRWGCRPARRDGQKKEVERFWNMPHHDQQA